MLYIPKIDDYLDILADEEVEYFVAINFSESIKEEQNLIKVAKSLYIFLAIPDEVNILFYCLHTSSICILVSLLVEYRSGAY